MCLIRHSVLPALAGLFLTSPLQASPYADAVVSYQQGVGGSPGYTNANAALGSPSRTTPGPFGGPVDPFNPAYQNSQLVSVGAGGSLTVQFSSLIANSANNPFGLDFLIFGNAGFVITNGDYSGGGKTDGSLFGQNNGTARVSVSADGVNYYVLNPAVAPAVDNLFPTDGSGDFSKPVNPQLSNANFTGQDLSGIRSLYAGSGGGAGFDIGWALDANGQPVSLDSISFVRIDALADKVDIDGFSMVPEPSTWTLLMIGAALGAVLWSRKTRMLRRT